MEKLNELWMSIQEGFSYVVGLINPDFVIFSALVMFIIALLLALPIFTSDEDDETGLQKRNRWNLKNFWGLPWVLVSLTLLTYIGYRDFNLIELTIWLLGTMAISPVIAVLVDKVLNPYSTTEYLRSLNYEETSWPMLISQLRRVAILIAIILAIAIGR